MSLGFASNSPTREDRVSCKPDRVWARAPRSTVLLLGALAFAVLPVAHPARGQGYYQPWPGQMVNPAYPQPYYPQPYARPQQRFIYQATPMQPYGQANALLRDSNNSHGPTAVAGGPRDPSQTVGSVQGGPRNMSLAGGTVPGGPRNMSQFVGPGGQPAPQLRRGSYQWYNGQWYRVGQ